MIRRLGLVAAGATAAQRSLRFPADDDAVEPMGALAPPAPFDTAVRGPERRCRETAGLLGVAPATAWRVDVEPLAGVVLERSGPGWRVLLGTPPRLRQTGGRGGPGGSAGPGGAAGRRP